MQENYRIFLDSGAGLLHGGLQLTNGAQGASGLIEVYGHPLELTDVCFEGNRRRFTGTLELPEQSLSFRAEGELEDDVLDVMVHAAGRKLLLTGFLQK